MSSLNIPENFAGRVNFAALVISQGRPSSRSFDNCFENCDGDAVVAALVRRAEKNERLAANLPKYINASSLAEAKGRFPGQKLAAVAREMRARRKVAA
jgi:hypothetical protein